MGFAVTLIDAIDTILTIGYLGTYTVSLGNLGGLEGLTDTSPPASITIAPDCNRKNLVLAHEIGHIVPATPAIGSGFAQNGA